MPELNPHPRLIATRSHFQRLSEPTDHPLLLAAQESVRADAEAALASMDVEVDPSHHNALLVRARNVQARVINLLVRWHQTGEARFRRGVMDHVRLIGQWEYWSWIAMRRGEPGPLAHFDLSYGENCATLALAFDWLAETVTDSERELFTQIARQWGIEPFLHQTGKAQPPFWYRAPGNNWNTVCTGGAGMLALAMHEHLDGADAVLQRTDDSFQPYMAHLEACGGGWAEGVGYWNYGMLYAFRYLLSWTRAFGRRHPLLELDSANRTLEFPLDFTPNGVALGFGDVNRFRPFAFHYAACEAFDRTDLYPRLDAALGDNPAGGRGNAAELLLFHPREVESLQPERGPIAKRYPSMDWAVLADASPRPEVCLTIRGGSTQVNHSHLDLMSFNLLVGDEPMLANVGNAQYMDTTFSERRHDLWEIRPDAKNTVFINGVGIVADCSVAMHEIHAEGLAGFRLQGAAAFGRMRDGPVAEVCNRALLLLDTGHALIVDRFRVPFYARFESRFHTTYDPAINGASARIDGERRALHLFAASSRPAAFYRAIDPVTSVEQAEPANMIRWCTQGLFSDCWYATLLGREPESRVTVEPVGEGEARVRVEGPAGTRMLTFDESLALIATDINASI